MRKIFYIIIVITTFFFLGVGKILFQHEKNLLLETSRENVHHELKILGGMAQRDMLSNNYSHIEETLLNWVELDENLIFTEVALDSGFTIAQYGQKGKHPDYFTVTETVPLFDGGSLKYTVDISTEFIEEKAHALFIRILTYGTIITILLMASLWLLIYKVAVVPLNKLMEGTQKIGQGDLDLCIKIESKDEFGKLASEVNLMATRLHGLIDELRRSEQIFRNIFDSSSDAIFVHDFKGKMLDVNMVASQRLGYTREELMNMNPGDFDSAEFFEKVSERIEELMKKGQLLFETCHISKEGEAIPTEVSSRTIEYEGKPAILSVARDITERKAMEEELLKAQKLESIGVLAGGIAHDFNNLLTAIMNNLFLMKKHISPEEPVYERIIATERASARAQDLTQQLLTFSKGGAPIKRLIDIRELVSESVSISLRGSNVRCDNLIPYDVWHIEADAGQMNQAINNILINADQSMPDGGTITINCENVIVGPENNLPLKEGNYIKISIRDQGTGIADEQLSRIFDPYFTTKEMGSGLGLSTTYSIIKKHGGHINIESELGVGSVFNIYLPASMEKVKIKKPAEDESVTETGKVLIMDDDELVRDSLGQILINIGCIAEFAGDGREAIDSYKNAMASDHPFDAVIMDLTIPGGMGGKEAIRELIKIDPNVKAIVSSGYSYDPIMSNYRDYGFRAVLKKPYKDIIELNRILNNVIDGKVK